MIHLIPLIRRTLRGNALRRLTGAATGLGALALTELAYGKPKPEKGWALPRDASLHGHQVDWLINITMVFLTILFVIMCAWMAIACLKHNKSHTADYDHGDSKHSIKTAFGLSALIFFVVDGNLWADSTADVAGIALPGFSNPAGFWNFAAVEAKPDTLRIEINARQWIWDARYAGPDGKFNTEDDILTTNDVRIPVDTPVYLQLSSPDVIHSLYLPNFRIKQDAVPGMINRMWFQAKETGDFDIACAQHCGANHYKMKGQLTVLPKAEFQAWAAQASDDSKRIFDANDTEAQWGWKWQTNK